MVSGQIVTATTKERTRTSTARISERQMATHSVKVPARMVRDLIARYRRNGCASIHEGRAGMAYWPARRVFLLGGESLFLPFQYRISVGCSSALSEHDVDLRIDPATGAINGVCRFEGERAQLAVKTVGEGWAQFPTVVIVGEGRFASRLAAALLSEGVSDVTMIAPRHLVAGKVCRAVVLGQEGDPLPIGEALKQSFETRILEMPKAIDCLGARLELRDADLIIVATSDIMARQEAASYSSSFLIPTISVVFGEYGEEDPKSCFECAVALPGDGCLQCVASQSRMSRESDGVRQGSMHGIEHLAVSAVVMTMEEMAAGAIAASNSRLYAVSGGEIEQVSERRIPFCDNCDRTGYGDFGLLCEGIE